MAQDDSDQVLLHKLSLAEAVCMPQNLLTLQSFFHLPQSHHL